MLPIIDIVAWTNVAAIVQNRLTFVANIAELQQQTPIVWRLPLPIVILWPCYGCLQALAVRMFTFKKCLNFRNRGKTFLSRVASWSEQQLSSDVGARLIWRWSDNLTDWDGLRRHDGGCDKSDKKGQLIVLQWHKKLRWCSHRFPLSKGKNCQGAMI